MKKKKSKIKEPEYICCIEGKNFCGDIIRKFVILSKSKLMKELMDGSRFDYIFNTSDAIPVSITIDLEEEICQEKN